MTMFSLSTPPAGETAKFDLPNAMGSLLTLEHWLMIFHVFWPDRVIVLDTAIKSARKSGKFRHRPKAVRLIMTLLREYQDELRKGRPDAEARRFLGNAYAAKEPETLTEQGRRGRTFTYDGVAIEMLSHLRIGAADNPADTLRIHFTWMSSMRRIVIGYGGPHLPP